MNRSILIVICDFLLLSLLTFSSMDPDALTSNAADRQSKLQMNLNAPETQRDLASVMKLALDDERQSHDQLLTELTRTRDTLGQQQKTLSERERELAERERQLQTARDTTLAKDAQARRLAEQKSLLEQQVTNAQANLQNLQRALTATTNEVGVVRDLAAVTREELRREQERATALQDQLSQLAKSNQLAQARQQQLATQLQVAEAEKRAVAEQAARMQEEVKIVREEKERLTQHAEKLADGVKALASRSGELAQEIRENRALAPNTIFNEFSTNRVHGRFHAYRPGMLGLDHNRRKETEMILVTDGSKYFALCHINDTAVALSNPSTDWVSVTGALACSTTQIPIKAMAFALLDPRAVLVPVTPQQAKELGCKAYRIAQDPFKFQEAVLVGAREGYYGECKFEIDLTTPQYVKMDRSLVRGLFGKFNPTHGDLVFSKGGELLGIMANNTYCLRILNFNALATLDFGLDVREQHTGELLSRFATLVSELPSKLQ